ncbi:MAG: stage V sporulation protein S [Chloroflexota bacterium]|nr:stage V sporulation protein S [Chloroflexota bacterium]
MTHYNGAEINEYEGDLPVVVSGKADIIKVSARSRSTAVAGAIAAVMREHHYAEVQAIGAGAVNQAVKALAIARGYLTGDAIDIVCVPYFTEVDIEGQERTAVRFVVEPRSSTPV